MCPIDYSNLIVFLVLSRNQPGFGMNLGIFSKETARTFTEGLPPHSRRRTGKLSEVFNGIVGLARCSTFGGLATERRDSSPAGVLKVAAF